MPIPVDITQYYEEAARVWGLDSLPPLDQIRVTFEERMTSNLGRAFPKSFHRPNGQTVCRDYYAITLSLPWFAALGSAAPGGVQHQLRDTIIHELAHIVCYFKHPGELVGHGKIWKDLCSRAGVRPMGCAWTRDGDLVPETSITWAQVRATKKARS